jgi:hypothetical protein
MSISINLLQYFSKIIYILINWKLYIYMWFSLLCVDVLTFQQLRSPNCCCFEQKEDDVWWWYMFSTNLYNWSFFCFIVWLQVGVCVAQIFSYKPSKFYEPEMGGSELEHRDGAEITYDFFYLRLWCLYVYVVVGFKLSCYLGHCRFLMSRIWLLSKILLVFVMHFWLKDWSQIKNLCRMLWFELTRGSDLSSSVEWWFRCSFF